MVKVLVSSKHDFFYFKKGQIKLFLKHQNNLFFFAI